MISIRDMRKEKNKRDCISFRGGNDTKLTRWWLSPYPLSVIYNAVRSARKGLFDYF